MISQIVELATSPAFLFAVLTAVSVFATLLTLLTPMMGGEELKARMKSVAIERDELRARERARLASEKQSTRGALRMDKADKNSITGLVERLDLKNALADDKTVANLRAAGYRGQQPLNIFLFARFTLPFAFFGAALVYVYVLDNFADQTDMIRFMICIGAAYAGFYAPNLYIGNMANKRKASIKKAWPDSTQISI
ncbi:MAG: type II secretion system F family protein, partial [Pseudomonadota bacterium]